MNNFRGEISNGFNLLVPIDIFADDFTVEDIIDWKLYSREYLKDVVDICIEYFEGKIKSLIDYNFLQELFNFYLDPNYSKETNHKKERGNGNGAEK